MTHQIMSVGEIQKILDKVDLAHWTGIKFTAFDEHYLSLVFVRVELHVEDAKQPGRKTVVTHNKIILGNPLTEHDVLRLTRDVVWKVMQHEVDEFFSYKGLVFDSPHSEGDRH